VEKLPLTASSVDRFSARLGRRQHMFFKREISPKLLEQWPSLRRSYVQRVQGQKTRWLAERVLMPLTTP